MASGARGGKAEYWMLAGGNTCSMRSQSEAALLRIEGAPGMDLESRG